MRRNALVAAVVLLSILVIFRTSIFRQDYNAVGFSHEGARTESGGGGIRRKYVDVYFDQVFSESIPAEYDFPALHDACERSSWSQNTDPVYLQCSGIAAGLTTIMSQVKVCLKMAIETGSSIVLPRMPMRNSTDLTDFNFWEQDAYLDFDKWFDADHIIESMARVCPKTTVLRSSQLHKDVKVRKEWRLEMTLAPDYQAFTPYFWAGRSFKAFFEREYMSFEKKYPSPPKQAMPAAEGITIISLDSQFLAFRILDDPTGQDRRLWNDLGHLIRFKEDQRDITNELLAQVHRPYYGVHFRAESDTIWSSPEHQMAVDLDALDQAWSIYGRPQDEKPLVYLACGDQGQVEKFVAAGKARGWEVVHKWSLAQANDKTLKKINSLPFDFQGAVDMGIMIKADFFLGIIGSAFSSTIGNARDVTGRYRGSSFEIRDDEGARTHLFNDGDATAYACCL